MAAVHGPPSTKPRLPISQRWHLALRGRLLGALAPSSPFASAKTLLLSIDGRNGIDHHPGKTERVARSQPADAARHLSLQGRASLPAVRKIRRAPAATPR